MKRNILVYNCEKLMIDDYIHFIDQCYKAWQVLPVNDVDLIIEYKTDNKFSILSNTEKCWIWGIYDIGKNVDSIMNYVEAEFNLEHYIFARVRGGKIYNFSVIK